MNNQKYRREYNKLRYEQRKRILDTLRSIKQTDPGRYQRLLFLAGNIQHLPQQPIPADLDQIYEATQRHYYIVTTTGQLFYESAPQNTTQTGLLKILKQRHPHFSGDITQFVRCDCPACRARDVRTQTQCDYEPAKQLIATYFGQKGGDKQ